MRFQVGDIIRISSSWNGLLDEKMYPRSMDGEVIRIMGGSYPIKVKFNDVEYETDGDISMFREDELKLVRRSQ